MLIHVPPVHGVFVVATAGKGLQVLQSADSKATKEDAEKFADVIYRMEASR